MSCMSGSPNLNRFRDRGQVAVQLVSCGVLLPGLKNAACNPQQQLWKTVITGDTVTKLSIPIRGRGKSPEEGQR